MRTKIAGEYPEAEFLRSSAQVIYIADFSERTKAVRKVEIHETVPECPGKAGHPMDCFQLCNPLRLPIDFHIFGDHQFVDDKGKDIEHCECCFFPVSSAEGQIWIGFLEIKDCKVKNIVRYKEKTKEQIISTVRSFREKGILHSCRIYGIISFPRKKKVAFDQTIFDDITEYKRLYKKERIHFFAANEVAVKDEELLKIIR